MKLLTFNTDAGPHLGSLGAAGRIVDLTSASLGDPALASMQHLIEAGAAALDRARSLTASAAETLDPEQVEWLAPLPQPLQIRDFAVYEEHMRVAGKRVGQLIEKLGGPPADSDPRPVPPVWYQQPIYYKSNRFATAGPQTTISWPAGSGVIDYELELACVIGRTGRDITVADAGAHIFGFTLFNDLTARDWQFMEMQGPFGPAKGKDFDGANVFGPVIVTADEIGAAPALAMRAFVNGELWSEGNSSTMYWSFAEMIAHVSRAETLYAGEILGSGTVGGGCGLELGRFLQHGDVVTLEIEGIGRTETTIHAPHIKERVML